MSALLSPEQLRAELGDPDLLVLDVRWTLAGPDRDGYVAGHLPGAVFCDLDADLAAAPGAGGRHPLPEPEQLVRSMARLGVQPGRRVVVYDGGVAAAAARAWWALRWIGHDDVRVLDGGLPAWVTAGGSVETGDVPAQPAPAPSSSAGDATGEAGGGAVGGMPTVDADEILAGVVRRAAGAGAAGGSDSAGGMGGSDGGDGSAGVESGDEAGVLLDARAPERYRGEVEPIDLVAGHIPGARSLPSTTMLDAEGRYLPALVLRDMFAAAGADGEQPVTAYCGSGITASQLVLAAHEAGIDAALYPGSWSHWITDPSRPVATGAE